MLDLDGLEAHVQLDGAQHAGAAIVLGLDDQLGPGELHRLTGKGVRGVEDVHILELTGQLHGGCSWMKGRAERLRGAQGFEGDQAAPASSAKSA